MVVFCYIKPSPYSNARRALAYLAEMLTSVYFLHNKLRIKAVPYYKIDGTVRHLVKRSRGERARMWVHELLLHTVLASKVKADHSEKFDNPAIILGLNRDGLR